MTGTDIKIEDFVKAGVAYGYKKSRRHQSTKKSIHTTQNGIDIINLEMTKKQLEEAISFLKTIKEAQKQILFIGEKPEISQIIKEVALATNSPFIVNRFIGGSITNFSQIKKRIDRLATMLNEKSSNEWSKFTKKEQLLLQRELDKLDKNFGGLSNLKSVPSAIVLVDSNYEIIPVKEARKMNIPIISLSNTDCDISKIEYPIVMNDSSRSSVELVLNIIKNNLK